jgi:5-methylcytosine-specific restriction endonuclease McrA
MADRALRWPPEERKSRRSAAHQRWRAAHPEKYIAYVRAKTARRRLAVVEAFTHEQWRDVVDFYRGLCAYCDRLWEHQDHVVPLARGGKHALSNLVPACAKCNLRKSAKTWEPRMRHPFMERAA